MNQFLENTIQSFNNKIFNEKNGVKYIKPYGDMFNIVGDFITSNNVDVGHYCGFMTDLSNIKSVLTQTYLACVQTFSEMDNQLEMSAQYLINLNRHASIKYPTYEGKTTWFFEKDKPTLFSSEYQARQYLIAEAINIYSQINNNTINMSNSSVQQMMWFLVNPNGKYHEEYTVLLSFGVFLFVKSIEGLENNKKLLEDYLNNLTEIIKLDNKISLWDKPNYRGLVEF